ncbi:protein of unknown function [Methylorubrum extorquens]|uniref:Uncharacterized protein n=1 Tax=Methylorubrum extorquens TaxID=408 RepID=A0A2N9AZ00_METEX|nr:protein of unknown function [Methylorubrum extorquens]
MGISRLLTAVGASKVCKHIRRQCSAVALMLTGSLPIYFSCENEIILVQALYLVGL